MKVSIPTWYSCISSVTDIALFQDDYQYVLKSRHSQQYLCTCITLCSIEGIEDTGIMKRARNSAKAIIIKDGCLLVIHKIDDVGDYYILPGGGQHYYETLTDAVKREVKEETALDVTVGELLFIREYISEHHEFAGLEPVTHQVEFMFACQIVEVSQAIMGEKPDSDQVGVKWLPITELMEHRLYPLAIRKLLMRPIENRSSIYLGDIN